MAKKSYQSVEVRAANNGFVAFPDRRIDRNGEDRTFVFETFESLQDWLRANLVPLGDE